MFKATSIILLLSKIFAIIALVAYCCWIAIYAALLLLVPTLGMISGDASYAESLIASGVLAVYCFVMLAVFSAWQIASIVIFSKTRNKLLNATDKKQSQGWAIACIVISVLNSVNVLGLVGGILTLCLPESDFKDPDDAYNSEQTTFYDPSTKF